MRKGKALTINVAGGAYSYSSSQLSISFESDCLYMNMTIYEYEDHNAELEKFANT